MGNNHQQRVSSFTPTWCMGPRPITPGYITTTGNTGHKSSRTSSGCPKPHNRHRRNSSCEVTIDEMSPRVGCMGQIRRHKPPPRSNSSVQLSTSTSSSSSTSPQFNMFILKRGAGASSVTTTATTASSTSSSVRSFTPSPSVITGEFSLLMLKRVSSTKVLYEEMDPPRPVESKEAKPKDSVSLWKRRCAGGDGLQLQLQGTEHISVCMRYVPIK